jgi:hypothetical protein
MMDYSLMELLNILMEIYIMALVNKVKKMEIMVNLFLKMEINLEENFIKIVLKMEDILPKMEVSIMVPFKMGKNMVMMEN